MKKQQNRGGLQFFSQNIILWKMSICQSQLQINRRSLRQVLKPHKLSFWSTQNASPFYKKMHAHITIRLLLSSSLKLTLKRERKRAFVSFRFYKITMSSPSPSPESSSILLQFKAKEISFLLSFILQDQLFNQSLKVPVQIS